MAVVYPHEEDLAGEFGWKSGGVPVYTMEFLEGLTEFGGIEGECSECIEIFLLSEILQYTY